MPNVNETPGTVEALKSTLARLEGQSTTPAGLEVTNLAEVDLFFMRAKESDGRAVDGLVARTRTTPHAYFFVGNLSFPSGEIAAELDQRLPSPPPPTPAPKRGARVDIDLEKRRAIARRATEEARARSSENATGFGTVDVPSPVLVNSAPRSAKVALRDDIDVEQG